MALIINATPHDVTLQVDDVVRGLIEVPFPRPTLGGSTDMSRVARVEAVTVPDPECSILESYWTKDKSAPWNGTVEIPVERTTRTPELTGIPHTPAEGVFYIVSRTVAEAFPHRRDLLIPSRTIRDQQGRVIGCRAFARVSAPTHG
jgi:hypothetical protein